MLGKVEVDREFLYQNYYKKKLTHGAAMITPGRRSTDAQRKSDAQHNFLNLFFAS